MPRLDKLAVELSLRGDAPAGWDVRVPTFARYGGEQGCFVYGADVVVEQWEKLAQGAGALLQSRPADTLAWLPAWHELFPVNGSVDPAHPEVHKALWLSLVWELAAREIPGSPLRVTCWPYCHIAYPGVAMWPKLPRDFEGGKKEVWEQFCKEAWEQYCAEVPELKRLGPPPAPTHWLAFLHDLRQN